METRIPQAQQILHERGWHKGGLVGPNDTLCLVGSIYAAWGWTLTEGRVIGPRARNAEGNVGAYDDERRLKKIIEEHYPEYFSQQSAPGEVIPFFNDHGEIMLDDIDRVMEKAALIENVEDEDYN